MIAFDTNVLVYAATLRDPDKQEAAETIIGNAIRAQRAIVPLQAFSEFLYVTVRKLQWPVGEAAGFVEDWRAVVRSDGYNVDDFTEAVRAHRNDNVAWWDALIWATAQRLGADILVTEDLQDGRKLGRVTFLNPFNPANAARLGLA